MSEVTKITFYGKDFTAISEAGVFNHDSGEKIDKIGEQSRYKHLLGAFIFKYWETKKIDLDFPKNRALFYKYVGVFRIRELEFGGETYDVTLEISSRFDTGKKAYFLAAMLLCLDPKDLILEKLDKVNISFHQVMDIFLLFMYKNQLIEAAKKGIFRKYQRFENNGSRPRGTIDIARHIRENMGLKNGKIAYHYRELTANNPVNRLISAAYKRLCEKFPTLCEERINTEESVSSTLKTLQTELGYSRTNVRNIVKENLRPITHPYFLEYEDLRRTCLKILRDENVSIFDANCSEETEALYVDVTRLWEKFLESRLREKLKGVAGLSLTAQHSKSIFPELDIDKRKGNKARPDFVLWPGGQQDRRAIAILDAKFKPHWDDFFRQPEANAAINADRDKCFRDMLVFQARRTGVIFPFQERENDPDKNHIGCHLDYRIGISDDIFDMVRVLVPREGESFDAWYRELVLAADGALNVYLLKLQPKIRKNP